MLREMASKLSSKSVISAATRLQLPVIGLGTFQNWEEAVLVKTLNTALELGYRLIDTAFLYHNEHIIGKVLQEWFISGRLKRDDIFITTKLPPQGANPKYVEEFIEKQLKALQLEYVDLYLVHHAIGWKHGEELHLSEGDNDNSGLQLDPTTDHLAIWKEMEKQVDAGRAKYIGLSNFNINQIKRVLKTARIPPSNLQIELNLFLQSKEEQEFCRKHGITITSYATLGSPGVPQGFFIGAYENPLKDPLVEKLALVYQKTPAQVLLRHVVQLGVAVIPKSANPLRLKENLDIFDFELTEADMCQLNALDRGEAARKFVLQVYSSHPENPYPSTRVQHK